MNNKSISDEIIEKYYAPIYRYCLTRLNYNQVYAQDCTQEVFFIFIKKQSSLNMSDNIHLWLISTANFVIKNYKRKEGKNACVDISEVEITDKKSVLLDFDERNEIFDKLTDDEYKLLSSYYNTNHGSKSEIAEELGITLPHLYKKIERIKNKLK